jgi:hypothetical protein
VRSRDGTIADKPAKQAIGYVHGHLSNEIDGRYFNNVGNRY